MQKKKQKKERKKKNRAVRPVFCKKKAGLSQLKIE